MGSSTLGLGYAVTLADLAIAPFTASNTGRSAGVIYPDRPLHPAALRVGAGPTARRIGAYLMWTAFAATSVTSSMFLTALSPNLLAVGLLREEAASRSPGPNGRWASCRSASLLVAVVPLLTYLIYPPEVRSSPDVPSLGGQ